MTEWTIDQRFEDIEVHIRARSDSATIEYEVRPLMLWGDGNGPDLKFEKWNENGILDATLDPEEANLMIKGTIRFDGFSHNTFGEIGNEGYLHGCGREMMTRLGKIFELLFDMAIELMPDNKDYLT